MPAGPEHDREVVVVGGGLAGLACAHALARGGHAVRVLEASDRAGGRARSSWYEGRPVDRGFQVLFTGYPELRRFMRAIGIPRADLRPVTGGAAFHDGTRWHTFGAAPWSFARFTGMTAADRVRLARLGAEVVATPDAALLQSDGDALSTEAFLRDRGFSARAIETFFRPFFGVVFLDRSLGADPGYFRWLLKMLVKGPAAIPTDGLGMIADWAVAAIRQQGGRVDLDVAVRALVRAPDGRVTGVRTDAGDITARAVVLAADPPAAAALLRDVDRASAGRVPLDAASVATATFALARPLYRGRTILVNAAPDLEPGPRIDLVCQTTNVTRPHVDAGPHVLLATCVTTPHPGTPAGLEEAVERLVDRWHPGFPWRRLATSLGVVEHRFGQFRPLAGVRRELPGPRTAVPNLVLAGDLVAHPSLEGAVASGADAARIVAAMP